MITKRWFSFSVAAAYFVGGMESYSQAPSAEVEQRQISTKPFLYYDQTKSIATTAQMLRSLKGIRNRQDHMTVVRDLTAIELAWRVVGLGEFAIKTDEIDAFLNVIIREGDKEYVPFWIGGIDDVERILQSHSFPATVSAFQEVRSLANLAKDALTKIRARSEGHGEASRGLVDTTVNAAFHKLQQRYLTAPPAKMNIPAKSMLFVEPSDPPFPREIAFFGETELFNEQWVVEQLRSAIKSMAKEPNQSFGFHLARLDYASMEFWREALAWQCVALGEYSAGSPMVEEVLQEIMRKFPSELVPEWVGDRARRRLYLASLMFESNENAAGSAVMREAQSIFELAEQALEKISIRTGKPVPEYSGPYPHWRWRSRALPE